MLILITPGALPEKRASAWQRFLDWGWGCAVLSRFDRIVRACLWATIGVFLTLNVILLLGRTASVPPVKALEPEIVHASDDYTVYRLRFAWRSSEKACELTVFHDRPITWSLQCAPR